MMHAPFLSFFFELRAEGLKIGLSEWMALMEALTRSIASPSLDSFYIVARALLVKRESDLDVYDRVFARVFSGHEQFRDVLKPLMDWLRDPINKKELSAEERARLESLNLEELKRRFEERLKEQKERHDGGNRWIGTGGTSPFGYGGTHPSGVRVGGGAGQKTAVQVAQERRFAQYRNDRVLDTRDFALALKQLRKLSRHEGIPELELEETIEATSKDAGELHIIERPPRENQARMLLMLDVGGSMDPYSHLVETLFSAAAKLDHYKSFHAYLFHNCPYENLEAYSDRTHRAERKRTEDVLEFHDPDSYLVFVGDAMMAPSELFERFGAIDYGHQNPEPGIAWLHKLKTRFPKAIWLNPVGERGWNGFSVRAIRKIFPMFPLTALGLKNAIHELMRGKNAVPEELEKLFPGQ